jgi:NUBPL iron-transfer P-loop NTPase
MLPRAEFIVVTTPSSAAAKVARRAADMARKGHVRVAGVIENMSAFECEHGHRHALFGEGGGAELARSIGVELLGSLPIDPALSAAGDGGAFAGLDPESPAGERRRPDRGDVGLQCAYFGARRTTALPACKLNDQLTRSISCFRSTSFSPPQIPCGSRILSA